MPLFVPSLVHVMTGKTIQYALLSCGQASRTDRQNVARISHVLGYQFASMLGDELVSPWQYFNRGSVANA